MESTNKIDYEIWKSKQTCKKIGGRRLNGDGSWGTMNGVQEANQGDSTKIISSRGFEQQGYASPGINY
ncbi:MAG: hypothetical protein H7Z13_20675 [Ferruginibacter sp.]|nr:hypothetical protein [Ferruginibacter sp.]